MRSHFTSSNKTSGSTEDGGFLELLSDYHFLRSRSRYLVQGWLKNHKTTH